MYTKGLCISVLRTFDDVLSKFHYDTPFHTQNVMINSHIHAQNKVH